ncbi:putative membrane protein YjdF [Halohasta litchfieldiae]|uniref:Uncharacterized membrane protein YjdF n=1 Tax=Halohasta litchfieldiae TaxID=1073996 RepID=A0A1H6SPD5_9EURY|nr:hypothetical protein [Halohasta litchfieldiae]ATW89985.1 putative membrane protein YjdF [Halohasta litchfieldiae]SEI65482.1 Uncharacterized membrane protein YjdF [Halohasta litchfieldiae]
MTILPRPSVTNQRRLTRGMQLVLVGIVLYGIIAGQTKAITNGSMGLSVSFVPALMERKYDFPLDPWLGLWITLAVFLHTMGSAGLYQQIDGWDHITHAMSASLVAAIGYTFARAVDLHSDEIRIPNRFAFVFILIVVMAFGVTWELFEFGLDIIADETGISMPLAQHGLDDTVRDMMFNTLGGITVAIFGQAHLLGVAETVKERLAAGPNTPPE